MLRHLLKPIMTNQHQSRSKRRKYSLLSKLRKKQRINLLIVQRKVRKFQRIPMLPKTYQWKKANKCALKIFACFRQRKKLSTQGHFVAWSHKWERSGCSLLEMASSIASSVFPPKTLQLSPSAGSSPKRSPTRSRKSWQPRTVASLRVRVN